MSRPRRRFLVCVWNDEHVVSLERRKLYVALADAAAASQGLVRIVDESGSDYLYPQEWFAEIAISPALARALAAR